MAVEISGTFIPGGDFPIADAQHIQYEEGKSLKSKLGNIINTVDKVKNSGIVRQGNLVDEDKIVEGYWSNVEGVATLKANSARSAITVPIYEGETYGLNSTIANVMVDNCFICDADYKILGKLSDYWVEYVNFTTPEDGALLLLSYSTTNIATNGCVVLETAIKDDVKNKTITEYPYGGNGIKIEGLDLKDNSKIISIEKDIHMPRSNYKSNIALADGQSVSLEETYIEVGSQMTAVISWARQGNLVDESNIQEGKTWKNVEGVATLDDNDARTAITVPVVAGKTYGFNSTISNATTDKCFIVDNDNNIVANLPDIWVGYVIFTVPANGVKLLLTYSTTNLTTNGCVVLETSTKANVENKTITDYPYGGSPFAGTITVGRGKTTFRGIWLEIDATNVKIYKNTYVEGVLTAVLEETYAHALTLASPLCVSFKAEENAGATARAFRLINADGTVYEPEYYTSAGCTGTPYISVTGAAINVDMFTFSSSRYDRKLWCYGDSYFEYRWLPVVRAWGHTNFLMDYRAGQASSEALRSLKNAIKHGKPKYLLWAQGMNNNNDPDATTPNSTWLADTQEVVEICETNGIELILCTIPSVYYNGAYVKNNRGKNYWIRNSGIRYCDIANLVEDGNGNWKAGLKGADADVHPSDLGCNIIAAYALAEIPELSE